ncbi:hypothetical protein GOODEAATRI_003922 [Goodea atripinnis]|uniref:Uncharacterized protein n=1 Tax=Goodea atripinnis TaxID=208336 RepID=A0ABV0MYH0_9TELE
MGQVTLNWVAEMDSWLVFLLAPCDKDYTVSLGQAQPSHCTVKMGVSAQLYYYSTLVLTTWLKKRGSVLSFACIKSVYQQSKYGKFYPVSDCGFLSSRLC